VEQQQNYRKMGFNMAYNNIRFEGLTRPADGMPSGIVPVSEVPFDDILAYDSLLFPAVRKSFLANWIAQPDSVAFAAVQNGKIAGYGVIRRCRAGCKIGPLFANSKEIATHLLESLLHSVTPGQPFYLDIPDVNLQALEMAEAFHLSKVFETARMYSKPAPDIDLNKIFGITSFELG
jgi:hypothetical protein